MTSLFNIYDLKPKIGTLVAPTTNSYFCVDQEENIYFLSSKNHRILKFNKDGDFVTQIGSIDQGEEDLYYPKGIFVYNDNIYVLNGDEVKIFSLSGEYISGFSIPNIWESSSIYVINDLIFIDVRYQDIKNYNEFPLISIFDINGKSINKFGKVIQCQKWGGYLNFNSYFIDVEDDKIFGTFPLYPIIFCYDFKGKKLLYKDLRKMGIAEIDQIQEEINQNGMDTPKSILRETGTSTKEFSRGFVVNKKNHIFYAVTVYKPEKKHFLLHLDQKGEIIEKIVLKNEDIPLDSIIRLFLTEDDIFYGLGSIGKSVIFFRF